MLKRLFNALFIAFALVFSAAVFAQDQSTDCDKYPNSLGCSAVDTPVGEKIPQHSQQITIQNGPIFGGNSSCPSDISMQFHGRVLTLLPISTACNWIVLYIRPLVLLLAAITAVFIVLPLNED